MRVYRYNMGITIDNVPIPDPSEWNYQVGDLDSEGGRDGNGDLHRAYVTTKINYEFKWNGLEWEMLAGILAAVSNDPQTAMRMVKFTLVAPDPRTFKTKYTGQYYVGDRTGKCYYYLDEKTNAEIAVYDLKLKLIEY